MLNWQTITGSLDPRYMVKGTELAQAILPGNHCRFALVEVRCYDADRNSDVTYRVRDAETVTDAEVKSGTRPRVVFEGSYDDALKFCGVTES